MSDEKKDGTIYPTTESTTHKVVREATFEAAVQRSLLQDNGFFTGAPSDYDKTLCLMPQTVLRFLQATQPEKWDAYRKILGEDAEPKVLRRVRDVIDRNGTLYLLRKGFDESGHHFEMCFFKPTHGLNPDVQKLYEGNVFHVVRQVHYSQVNKNSLDMTIFLNGLPIFTAELKNKLTGQTVAHARRQYKNDRDPKEPLFRFGRCLAHFAVDTDMVFMTTALAGKGTYFLPFNVGSDGGAGNKPRMDGISTAYLWEDVWTRDSILDLVRRFIQIVDELDEKGRKTGKKRQIFPRYHQLDAVRRLTDHARENGSGESYLNQHSAGSGKTIEIATLATSLATLYGADNKPVFTTVVVVSDARVIDRMLQRTLRQFVQTAGMLENIDQTSRQLKAALEDGKKIIVSTIHKFPVIMEEMESLSSSRFAVIIDEAHSSQAGKVAGAVNRVLSYAADIQDQDEQEDTAEDQVVAEIMKRRGRMKHVSFFAFTATPKPETLELFGSANPETKKKEPFSLYSMRQAIEERFILDVLKNYTTYNQYFNLLKTVQHDPEVDKRKATRLLKKYVADQRRPIRRKAQIMVDHFVAGVAKGCGGRAKAMIVTRNRLHAVRYAQEVRAYLEALGLPFKALVAFTDTVKDPPKPKTGEAVQEFTEYSMNGFPESQTEDMFNTDEYRFLVVANKFQTGFDQPLLKAMYVDRKLKGVQAVQTLSRLNRTEPTKGDDVYVLDFENDADLIKKAFQPFYDRVQLASDTDPNRLYDIRNDLDGAGVYTWEHVVEFCRLFYSKMPDTKKIAKLHGLTDPLVVIYNGLDDDERRDFKSKMRDYVKLYAFLSQIIPFSDAKLEKFYAFSGFLVKKLPSEPGTLPLEILNDVDLENYKPELIGTDAIGLERGVTEVEPKDWGQGAGADGEELEALSKIIEALNSRFGTKFSDEDRVVIKQLEERIEQDEVLGQQLKAGSKDAVRLSFEQVAQDMLHDLIESNFRFYRKVQDDQDISKELFDRLFERYYDRKEQQTANERR
jgi:type I restriction enzyme R subunit